jgi:hypothetical protein
MSTYLPQQHSDQAIPTRIQRPHPIRLLTKAGNYGSTSNLIVISCPYSSNGLDKDHAFDISQRFDPKKALICTTFQ